MASRSLRYVFGWLLPLLAGALLSFAYEPFALAWLGWAVPIVLTFGIYAGAPVAKAGRWGLRYGFLAGAGFFLLNVKWLYSVSPFASTALALFLTTFWALWGFVVAKWGHPYHLGSKAADRTPSSLNAKIAAKAAAAEEKKRAARSWRFAGSGRSLYYATLAASAWVFCEWLRGVVLTGFPWNGLGLAVADSIVMAQAADLVGVTGLSFLPVFVAAVLVQTVRRMVIEVQAGRLRPGLDFAVAVLLIVVTFGYGALRILQVQKWETDSLGVALIQQNIPQSIKWEDRSAEDIYAGYVELTEQAVDGIIDEAMARAAAVDAAAGELGEGRIPTLDLVVWPETAIPEPFYYASDGVRRLGLRNEQLLSQQVLPLGDFSLVLGCNDVELEWSAGEWVPKHPGRHYNAMMAFSSGTKPDASYRKVHRVIYGEYIPLIDTVPLMKGIYEWATGVEYYGNIAAGESLEPMAMQRGDLSYSMIPSICFEDSIARLTRKFVRAEPQMIVNVTNDGWFLETEAALQHAANARMRAIELRRPMVRAANTGLTVMYDHVGNVVKTPAGDDAVVAADEGKTGHFTADWVFADVEMPTRGPITVYARIGDAFSWICGAVVLLMIVRRQKIARC